MNRKAIELAISTLILLILGILVLIGIILAVTGGFNRFKSATEPFTDVTASSAIKQACSIACDQKDKLTYCCKEYKINEETIFCSDKRLEVSCQSLTCEPWFCNPLPTTPKECEDQGGIALGDIGDGSTTCPPGKELIAGLAMGREGGICCK